MKKIAFYALSSALCTLFFACNDAAPIPGFDKSPGGLIYKIHETNSQARKVQAGDIITLNLIYKNSDDSIIFNTNDRGGMQLRVDSAIYAGDISEGFLMLHEGDSATFITSADSFFQKIVMAELPPFVKPGTNLTFELRVTEVKSLEELRAEADKMAAEMAEKEKENILQYVAENAITTEPKPSGLYYIETKKGKGAKAEPGKTVRVHYTGTLLDGTKFDSSVDRNEPFEFTLGQGMVIKGWDEAISYMQVGGTAKLIIPSFLGYGEQQRGPLITPFSTLVFEVELIEVK